MHQERRNKDGDGCVLKQIEFTGRTLRMVRVGGGGGGGVRGEEEGVFGVQQVILSLGQTKVHDSSIFKVPEHEGKFCRDMSQ